MQLLIAPTPAFEPIDLSSLGIPPTDKLTRIVERFNTFASNTFNPETPVEPKNPEMSNEGNTPQQSTSNIPQLPQEHQIFDPYPAADGK